MARPKIASDEEILHAAHRVYIRRGYDGFTLSEVAREVGLSRAAIIQRFDSAQALRMTLTRQMVTYFREALAALPVSRGGDGLLSLAAFVGRLVPDRAQLGAFLQNFQADIADEGLARLEAERSAAMLGAVSARMPAVSVDHDAAVAAFVAHLGGSLMQWQVAVEAPDAAAWLVERTRTWLTLAGIPFGETVAEYPAIPFPETAAAGQA